jgi:tetratricopeptide (TPR) repeat protein
MWCAVGNCLSRLGSKKDAIAALERAVSSGDSEGIATRELARLYRESGQPALAAACYQRHLQLSSSSAQQQQQQQSSALPTNEGLTGSGGLTGGTDDPGRYGVVEVHKHLYYFLL